MNEFGPRRRLPEGIRERGPFGQRQASARCNRAATTPTPIRTHLSVDAERRNLEPVAALAPVRTREIAHALGAAPVTLRANLQRMSAAGWVEPVGRTKARWYPAGPRLLALDLRVPAIWRWMRSGQREPRSELDDPA